MGWSVLCDCGISWSYSLTFFIYHVVGIMQCESFYCSDLSFRTCFLSCAKVAVEKYSRQLFKMSDISSTQQKGRFLLSNKVSVVSLYMYFVFVCIIFMI